MEELKDPESLDEINSLKVTDEIRDFVTELSHDVASERTRRSNWEQRIDDYTRKRYGIRNKKTFPWLGAANFVLPQMDSDINRIKPAYINLAYGVSPIVTFEPYGPEDVIPARKREVLFDWRMRTQVKFFKDYCLGVDYMLHSGFTLFKTGWRFETRCYVKKLDLADLHEEILMALYMPEVTDEILGKIFVEEMKPDMTLQENLDAVNQVIKEFRAGKTKFEFKFYEKSINRAEAIACNPRIDVTFPINTVDIQEAKFISYRFTKSKNQLKISMESGKYNTFSDDEIDSWRSSDYSNSSADQIKSIRDGVSLGFKDDDEITLCEDCAWYDVNNDGIAERVIITYPENNPQDILRFIENPYDHGLFPYVVIRREFNDAEIMSSRGIPALDDDFQTGISTLFNQDIDAGTITTTPTVVARKNSVKNLRNLRYVPGQVVETENGPNDYAVVQNTNLGQANRFNNMQYLKSWANDRIGNVSAAVSQSNNTPGGGANGQKTAREVAAIESSSGQLQSMDLLVFQNQMADLYYQIDSLYYQFGDEQEEISITGMPPVKISRFEIQGKFNIVPNGRLDNSNPALRAQKSLARMQMFNNDPYVRQDQLRKLYLDDDDIRVSQLLLKTPQEMQADAQAQQQQMAQQMQSALLMQQGKDNLDIRKEAILAPIKGREYGMRYEMTHQRKHGQKESSGSKK